MILEIKNLNKCFGKKLVYKDTSLSVPEGGIVGVLGLNGAGKTTLFNILSGLEPCQGTITKYKKDEIAYMSVENHFFGEMNLKFALNFYNDFYKNFDKRTAEEELLKSGFILNQQISSLSMGQYRYFSFVLTINRTAKLYLLDEPLANLDIIYREKLVTEIINSCDGKKTILISSHDMRELESILSHFVIVHNNVISPLYDVEEIRSEASSLEGFYREVIC